MLTLLVKCIPYMTFSEEMALPTLFGSCLNDSTLGKLSIIGLSEIAQQLSNKPQQGWFFSGLEEFSDEILEYTTDNSEDVMTAASTLLELISSYE